MRPSRALEALGDGTLTLDVNADLTLSLDGDELEVESYTDRVVVDVPSAGVATRVFRRTGDVLPEVARVLAAADLTAVVRMSGRSVAVLGAAARPGRFGRRLDAPVELDASEMLTALVLDALG